MSELRQERAGSPTGWRRLLFRSPIPIFRAGLGFLFGSRLTMLEHKGRKTGQIRRTILEVAANHPDAVYVAAAWGAEAQWLKNVMADPRVTFYVGARKYETVAEMVSDEQALELMGEYAEEHPQVLDRLAAFMLETPGKTPEEQARRVAEKVPMIRLPK